MNIEDSRAKTIYRNEVNGKALYSIGISHKKQDGNWENGFISCRFPKDADIQNKQKIMIVQGWLDFYIKDKKTYPYIFINKYEIVQENKQDVPQNVKTDYSKDSDIQLTDDDIDKTFNNDSLELPF